MREDFYPYYFSIEERHWWFVGRRRILLSILDRLMPERGRPRAILDIGCGTGATLEQLRRYGQVTGVDADPQAVAFCRRRGLDQVSQEEAPFAFTDASFDLITALDVVEHVDDDLGLLTEIARLLKPGGHALITVPAYQVLWGPQDEVSDHKRRYRAAELSRKIAAAGMEPERTTYFNTLLFPPIAAIRLVGRLLPRRGEPRSDFEMTDPDGRLNRALAVVFAAETNLLTRGDLPFGISIACVARQRG